MRPSLKGALALSLLAFSTTLASAAPKEDVAAATAAWGSALGEDNPDKVLPLYSDDAVLWGTLSPTVRSNPAALRDYFVSAFKVLPELKVTFGEELIRVYGDTAVNTRYYTVSYVKDGETKTLPARYSFTFVKKGDHWLIVDHHSLGHATTTTIGRQKPRPRRRPGLKCVKYCATPHPAAGGRGGQGGASRSQSVCRTLTGLNELV